MKYKSILLTGGSGNLGSHIQKSGLFQNLLVPSEEEMDITKPDLIEKLFAENEIDAVIHCAALARVMECEKNPAKAVKTNIDGTANLVSAVKKKKMSMRFVHISTDAVYPGTKGNYSEKDETMPYNVYGWTKLGAETLVQKLPNFCIIRTRFFNPEDIPFDTAATDAYSSKMPIKDFVKAIVEILENDFVGVINIGGERKSDYEIGKEFKPSIKPCTLKDILKNAPLARTADSSMNCSLWKSIKAK